MNNRFIKSIPLALTTLACFNPVFAEELTEAQKDENKLIITAELKDQSLLDLAGSISLVDAETIEHNNAQNLSDILNLVPNVNFATGASRGRFIQIRGVGERSEFTEPVNYSVGVMVDGIDMTGIATAATLLDIQQVEVLRGPQGTLAGANGLAGLINVVSNSPTDSFYSSVSASLENYSGRSLSAVVSGSASENLGYRFAVGQYQSDGYMDNVYLGRDNTNNIDETSLRGKFVFDASDKTRLTGSLFLIDVDNGYDAFSLDNERVTYSDEPGHDRQETKAFSLKLEQQLTDGYSLEALVSTANSDLEYGYDEDWSYPGICDGLACEGWAYASTDSFTRENDNNSVDLRLHSDDGDGSTNWVLGYYYRQQQVDLLRQYTYAAEDFFSDFETKNTALYGQVNTPLSDKLTLSLGARFENRQADYLDNAAAEFHPDENLWGGKIALEYSYTPEKMLYALISRGYKAGGFNPDNSIDTEGREYDTEFMWNYEAGIKGRWVNDLTLQASVFYQDRDDIQTKQSIVRSIDDGLLIQQGGEGPYSFTDYLANAAKGNSYGLELEAQWRGLENAHLYTSLGLLKTKFDGFQSYTHAEADLTAATPVAYDMDGRAFAHSPKYQLVVGANFFITDKWTLSTQLEAKDAFYFSDRHEEKSGSYEVVNMGLDYQQDNWELSLFVRNLFDKDIYTRGFGSFGNDPRKFYETEPYYQFAAPRTFGVKASVTFE